MTVATTVTHYSTSSVSLPLGQPRKDPVVRDGRCRSGPLRAQPARTSTRRGCSFGARGKRSVSTPCFSSA
jgi:hypothetical protein